MSVSKEAIEAGLRITLSSVNMPSGECLHETDVREILEAALPFLPIAGEGKAIHEHFKQMQEMCRDYLIPETYVRRFPDQPNAHAGEFNMPGPHQSEQQAGIMNSRRDRAFISDIIRMLDGPEQREAEALVSSPGKDGGTAGALSFADGIRAAAALFETAPDEPVDDITKLTREAQRQGILSLLKSGKDGGQEPVLFVSEQQLPACIGTYLPTRKHREGNFQMPLYAGPQDGGQEVEAVGNDWHDGAPPKPWCDEWFIAQTTYGDRVVLTALPEEWTYDFKTADDTYIKADKIKRWMQFPDSQFLAYQPASTALVERLTKALEPFSFIAGELFANNYNDSDIVFSVQTKTEMGSTVKLDVAFSTFREARNALSASQSTSRENADA